jgi:UPF0716 protein FxsA
MKKFLILFTAFTVIPAIELGLLVWIGQFIGPWATAGIVVLTGGIGAWLAKREGFGVLKSLKEESQKGFPAGDRIVEGVLVLVGGVLLITPGVLTDVTGFLLIAPPSRRWLAPKVKAAAMKRMGFTPMTPSSYTVGDKPLRQEPPAPPKTGPWEHPTL